MEIIETHVRNGKKVYIECQTGLARKYYHQWAQRLGFSSKPAKRKEFKPRYLYKCPKCQMKGYKTGAMYNMCTENEEREYPSILDKESWDTSYDEYYGEIHSYAIMCPYCTDDIEDYFLIHDPSLDNIDEINRRKGDKIIRETCNAILILIPERALRDDKMDENLKTEIRRYSRNPPRDKHNRDKEENLDNILKSLDEYRKYIVI